jgi:hypothetical protein
MKSLFHSVLYGLGTMLALLLVGACIRPLRPACDFLLSPGALFGSHDPISIVISLFLDSVLYSAVYLLLLRIIAMRHWHGL